MPSIDPEDHSIGRQWESAADVSSSIPLAQRQARRQIVAVIDGPARRHFDATNRGAVDDARRSRRRAG
jgi:hypothetical protein